jgi:uncharacterized membrane-anchored protein
MYGFHRPKYAKKLPFYPLPASLESLTHDSAPHNPSTIQHNPSTIPHNPTPPKQLRNQHPTNQQRGPMNQIPKIESSKVPEVTLVFWIIKIAATTLGETGGDALSMSLKLGYAVSTLILLAPFFVLIALQIRAKSFHPYLYWAVIVGTTLAGTTMADFADRSLGIGYPGGATILFLLVIASLIVWRFAVGTVSVNCIVTPKAEMFYWLTILFSNTLGTALGDWTSETTGFGGGVFLFLGLIAIVGLLYFFTKISHTTLFWTAFILTRPLGANMGDLLTKPHIQHGLDLSRFAASGVIAVFMILCIALLPQKSGYHPGSREQPV